MFNQGHANKIIEFVKTIPNTEDTVIYVNCVVGYCLNVYFNIENEKDFLFLRDMNNQIQSNPINISNNIKIKGYKLMQRFILSFLKKHSTDRLNNTEVLILKSCHDLSYVTKYKLISGEALTLTAEYRHITAYGMTDEVKFKYFETVPTIFEIGELHNRWVLMDSIAEDAAYLISEETTEPDLTKIVNWYEWDWETESLVLVDPVELAWGSKIISAEAALNINGEYLGTITINENTLDEATKSRGCYTLTNTADGQIYTISSGEGSEDVFYFLFPENPDGYHAGFAIAESRQWTEFPWGDGGPNDTLNTEWTNGVTFTNINIVYATE